jgi:hypothetical protein
MAEYEAYIRYFKDDVLLKLGEEIKLIVRDTERYLQRPVRAKIHSTWTQGIDKLDILDPLGRKWRPEPFGLEIIKEEDEEKLLDSEYQKACLKV